MASAADYAAVFERSGDPFPGVNASTLTLLGGDAATARKIAARVLSALTAPSDYWGWASVAEAAAVCGDMDRAAAALAAAAGFEPDEGARASTLRQLRLLSEARGIDPAWLAPLHPRGVVHFTGHMIGARFAAGDTDRVAAEIVRLLEMYRVGFGYGSLAGGADILFAEALTPAAPNCMSSCPSSATSSAPSRSCPRVPVGVSASTAASRPRSRSASPPPMPGSTMTVCSPIAAAWPWASRG